MKRVPLVALAAAAILLTMASPLRQAHFYGNAWTSIDDGRLISQNAGIVLWDCGPGFEWRGTVGFFTEGDC